MNLDLDAYINCKHLMALTLIPLCTRSTVISISPVATTILSSARIPRIARRGGPKGVNARWELEASAPLTGPGRSGVSMERAGVRWPQGTLPDRDRGDRPVQERVCCGTPRSV